MYSDAVHSGSHSKAPAIRPERLTVAGHWLEFLLDAAHQAGVDLDDELARQGITREQLAAPHSRAPLHVEQALLQAALTRSNDPCFGLHMGAQVRPRFLGALGYAAMSSATLRHAMALALPFQRVTHELLVPEVERQPGRLILVWQLHGPPSALDPQRMEIFSAASITFGRWITGAVVDPLSITFRHHPAGDPAEYERVFRCPVTFGAATDSIVLDDRVLDLPIRDADPEVHRISRTRVQQVMTRFMARDNLIGQVRAAIQRQLLDGAAQLDSVATALGMKPWTLRRRLRAEGADFTTLLDDERRALATDWLLHSNRPVSQIATDLGYSEQSAFNRAFRRWFDCTPVSWREQQRL